MTSCSISRSVSINNPKMRNSSPLLPSYTERAEKLELRKRALFRRAKSCEDLNVPGCDLQIKLRGGKRRPRRHKSTDVDKGEQPSSSTKDDRWASHPRRDELSLKSDRPPKYTSGRQLNDDNQTENELDPEIGEMSPRSSVVVFESSRRKGMNRWDSDSSSGSNGLSKSNGSLRRGGKRLTPPRRSNSQENDFQMPSPG